MNFLFWLESGSVCKPDLNITDACIIIINIIRDENLPMGISIKEETSRNRVHFRLKNFHPIVKTSFELLYTPPFLRFVDASTTAALKLHPKLTIEKGKTPGFNPRLYIWHHSRYHPHHLLNPHLSQVNNH